MITVDFACALFNSVYVRFNSFWILVCCETVLKNEKYQTQVSELFVLLKVNWTVFEYSVNKSQYILLSTLQQSLSKGKQTGVILFLCQPWP